MGCVILFAILATGPALAQNRPSLTWHGEVTAGATLFIQGNRVDVQGRDTGSVDRPTYRFRDMLPAVAQDVEMRVVRGRGRVLIDEHPSAANQYTAIVNIRNDGRPEVYDLQFFWADDKTLVSQNRREDRRNRDVGPGQVTWSGDVDNEVFIVFTNRRALTTAVRGRDVGGANAEFSAPIPRGDVVVNLTSIRGRGRVELMEQPSSRNGFAAKVRVLDEQSGTDTYSFTLTWDGDVRSPNGGSISDSPGVRWSGRVDGTIRVTIRGDRVTSERIGGGPISGERASVGTPLPRRNLTNLDIRKIGGRGHVEIVQPPSSGNDYSLVFEIKDDDGGADLYEVEITWR